jgi:hypothetical protein
MARWMLATSPASSLENTAVLIVIGFCLGVLLYWTVGHAVIEAM